MKARAKKLCLVFLVIVFVLIGSVWVWLSYLDKYVHQHCIKAAGAAFNIYSSDHQGWLPFSTNGFGNALLLLAREDSSVINSLCGPGDDGHLFKIALQNGSMVPRSNVRASIFKA